MCTGKNYQELLSRVGKCIDSDDVYRMEIIFMVFICQFKIKFIPLQNKNEKV